MDTEYICPFGESPGQIAQDYNFFVSGAGSGADKVFKALFSFKEHSRIQQFPGVVIIDQDLYLADSRLLHTLPGPDGIQPDMYVS